VLDRVSAEPPLLPPTRYQLPPQLIAVELQRWAEAQPESSIRRRAILAMLRARGLIT
jgi:hypothetical protein